MRQTLALMAEPAIRGSNAADTAIVVFAADLAAVLWANSAGTASFGLDAGGDPTPAADALLAQIAAARSLLARKGRTTLLLRMAQGFRSSRIPAEMTLVTPAASVGEEPSQVAVLTAKAPRPAYGPADRDAALLRETGLGDVAGVRLLATDRAAGMEFGEDRPTAETVAAFAAGDEAIAEVPRAGGASLLLARIADDRILVLDEAPDAEAATARPAASEASAYREAPEPQETTIPAEPATATPHASGDTTFHRRSNWGSPATGEIPAEIPSREPADAAAAASSPDGAPASDASDGRGAGIGDGHGDEIRAAPDPEEPGETRDDGGERAAPIPATRDGEDETREAPAAEQQASEPDAVRDERPIRRHSAWGAVPATQGIADAPAENAAAAGDTSARSPAPDDAPPTDAAPGDPAAGDPAAGIGDGPQARSGEAPEPAPGEDARKAGSAGAGDDDAGGALPGDETEAPPADIRPIAASDFSVVGPDEAARPSGGGFSPRLVGEPVRFVWRVDADGRFRSLSPEFAEAVGPVSAAVLERSVDAVARAYRLDEDGALRRLLARRETWSGRTVMWPLEASAKKVPVDLAALPIYARDRSFDGFRGFGVVRLADAEDDPDAIGLALAEAFAGLPSSDEAATEPDGEGPQAAKLPAFLQSIGAATPPVSFGRREPQARPADAHVHGAGEGETPTTTDPVHRSDKIIRLEERRRSQNGSLSQTEEAAFRAIGETLAQGSDPRDLVAAVRAASERIEAFEGERQSAQGDETGDETGGAGSDPSGTPDAAGDRPDHADAPAFAAEGGSAPGPDGPDPFRAAAAGAPSGEAPDVAAALEQAYGSLPMPILAQAGNALVYANREFLDLTGHADVAALVAAGGLEALVLERKAGDADFLRLRRANGQDVAIRARMQRTSVGGIGCLILSFFATPRLTASYGALVHAAGVDAASGPAPAFAGEVFEHPVLDLAADGVVLVDEAGTITAMSGAAQRLFDIPAGDVAGRSFLTLFAHESQKGLKRLLAGEDEAGGREGADTKWYARRDVIGRVAGGAFLPLAVSLGRVPGTEGFCAVIHDITRWKRAEETAEKARAHAEAANLQKSTFLSEVASEIRDPVDAMIGFADLMGSESLGPVGNERYLEYLDDIKRSGHQVIDLVTILHDLAKVESGRMELNFEAVSLAEIVSEVTAVMAPKANRQRVIVRTHLPSSVPPVVGDHDTIRQITTNLVANSIRSTPAGGQLIVSIKYDVETGVSLRFRDSGVGMRQDEIESALRAPGAGHVSSGAESGRLGLPLTKALAEANRAELSIASTPGEGTLVEVRFPPARVLLD
ncbi:cell-division control histidine kinase PdhS [Aurantimonas sp. 22II-16-19i]|nr:cell-division control histidine kinase PdhS [Aurantimonas sp. 22II-16-19i]